MGQLTTMNLRAMGDLMTEILKALGVTDRQITKAVITMENGRITVDVTKVVFAADSPSLLSEVTKRLDVVATEVRQA